MIRSVQVAQTSHPLSPGTGKRATAPGRRHPLLSLLLGLPLAPTEREERRGYPAATTGNAHNAATGHLLSPGTGQRARERGQRGTRLARLFALALALALAAPVHASEDPAPRLVVLDVGEGQALLLARGGHGVLIDGGRVGMGRHVLDRLAAHGVEQLDAVIYTHLHPDHAGSWFRIQEAFPGVRVIESGHRVDGAAWPDSSRWVAGALDALPEARHRVVRAGDSWTWRDVRIDVLWPERPQGRNLNRHSLVLALHYGAARALVMGDVDTGVERELLDRGTVPADVDVLVAGHHGSENTSSQALLAHARPRFAVVSTDADNLGGYPAEATIARLQQHAHTVLRTWRHGEACFRLAPGNGAARC